MSVQSQIDRLNAIKQRIRTNLVAQGITVPEDTMLEEMATQILSVAGYTPVRGTDYWTEADQESIVQQVIAALGTPVFGRVDADNNIILTGELAEGSYTLKYEDAEGNVTEVGTISTIETSGEIEVELTMGKIDSSNGTITASDNMLYSQLIPIESGKTYRLVANGICGGFKIAYYNSSGTFISCTSSNLAASESGQLINVDKEVPLISGASYFRLRVSALWYGSGYADSVNLLRNNVRLLWERV